MKKTDIFLIAIVAGIILLVVVAFAVALRRPAATFQSEETASGVVHNYLLALQQKDYERAYRYLSPSLKSYPATVEAFAEQVEDNAWRFRTDTETTLRVESERAVGNLVFVTVRESRFYGGGLFNTGQSTSTFEMKARREAGGWKLVDGDYYFAYCWREDEGCE